MKLFLKHKVYNIYVAEYKQKEDEEKKKNYIAKVYYSILITYMFSQIYTGLIENTEITEPDENLNLNILVKKDELLYVSKDRINKNIDDAVKIYENYQKFRLLGKLKKNKVISKKIINDNNDINELLSLKYHGKNVMNVENMKLLNFNYYMNQPTKWLSVYIDCATIFRNSIFLFANIKNKYLKFKASYFIKEDMNFCNLRYNYPHEFKFLSSFYHTDPTVMLLYKIRFYGCCIAFRIFLYRAILNLLFNSNSSKILISNIKTIINPKTIENLHKSNSCFLEKNRNIHKTIQESNFNAFDNKINLKDNDNDHEDSKQKSNDEKNVYMDSTSSNNSNNKNKDNGKDNDISNKQKYWINCTCYMEMMIDDLIVFSSSCIYHQLTFILKNILVKCIDYLLTNYIILARLSEKKEVDEKKLLYYEFPCHISMYEVGIIYLSKYVSNQGIDNYGDCLISLSTDMNELKKRINSSSSNDNWYFGKLCHCNKNKWEHYIDSNKNSPLSIEKSNNKNRKLSENKINEIDNNKEIIFENNKDFIQFKKIDENINKANNQDNNDNNVEFSKGKLKENKECENDNKDPLNICNYIMNLINVGESNNYDEVDVEKALHDFIDLNYDKNLKEKSQCCKGCAQKDINNTKENILEILKFLKYFINLDYYLPKNCVISKNFENLNASVYTDQTTPTYQYIYNKLKKVGSLTESEFYINKFEYLIEKANNALKNKEDSFENDVIFDNYFF